MLAPFNLSHSNTLGNTADFPNAGGRVAGGPITPVRMADLAEITEKFIDMEFRARLTLPSVWERIKAIFRAIARCWSRNFSK